MKSLTLRNFHVVVLLALLTLTLAACGSTTSPSNGGSSSVTVRLGYFPNLTHAVALVGVAHGTFQKALGSNVTLQTKIFNAGPAEIEALFANEIDIGYVGPAPAINGYVKSNGQALHIIAGAASGGALFIVRPQSNIRSANDLAGKKIADPQQGGTQDVALRYYLLNHGLKSADKGGTVQIVPTDNATILTLFQEGRIDGAWVPEPWATRLIIEGKGQVLVDERSLWPGGKFVTTNVVVSTKFLTQHPDLVNKFLQAHVETVQSIISNPDSAKSLVNSEIKRITSKALPSQELDQAYTNLDITYDPLTGSLQEQTNHAYALGFLGSSQPDLNGIYSLGPLNQVLLSKGLAQVQ
jgi:NitT/TauT family transport system substrate-binding protein